jgi:hypothetical protein
MNIIETYSHPANIADIVAENKTELLKGIKAPLKKATEEHQALADEVEAHSAGRAVQMWRAAIDAGNIEFIKEHKSKDSFVAHMAALKTAYRRKAEEFFMETLAEPLGELRDRIVELLDTKIAEIEAVDEAACSALSIPFEPSAPVRALNQKRRQIQNQQPSRTGSPRNSIKTLTDNENFIS